MTREVWKAEDADSNACSLDYEEDRKVWFWNMDEGPFSGYPTIELTRDDLVRLRTAVDKELSDG